MCYKCRLLVLPTKTVLYIDQVGILLVYECRDIALLISVDTKDTIGYPLKHQAHMAGAAGSLSVLVVATKYNLKTIFI